MKKLSEPKIKHLVANNPEVDRATINPKEVAAKRRAIKNTLYDSSYKTAAGHWKQRDEPDEAEQLRQSDRIRKHLLARQQKASRERLKTKNAVPTKQGKKLFEQFMQEAQTYRSSTKESKFHRRDLDDMENIYNAAIALEFDQWVIFVSDLLDADI